MELALSRRGSLPIREQLVAQLELKILAGELPAGHKLPSVRSLARRLKIHPNTVAAVYRRLSEYALIECERGSGAFVTRGAPAPPPTRSSLEELVQQALSQALQQGLTPAQIRAAVSRWLAAVPPTRVVVVETNRETAELLVQEIGHRLGTPVSWCTVDEATRDPERLSNALTVTWPYHQEVLRRRPGANLAVLTLRISAADTRALRVVPRGGLVVVVSHSPRVLRYAHGLLGGARGDLLIRCVRLSDRAEWGGLVGGAELVYADALSAAPVRRSRPRGVREFRLVAEVSHAAIRQRLALAAPVLPMRDAASTRASPASAASR
jgi:GntR family transcriptional regulator